jgi:hypothetical protein
LSRKTSPIHYLLILSIGFMPALALASNGLPQMDTMASGPVDCVSMGHAIDYSCDDDGCASRIHTCGGKTGGGYLPVNLAHEFDPPPRFAHAPAGASRYESRLADSIFRPPIA